MEPIVFKRENYNIASDIRLEADVAYIQGQPIVKTKTVVLYYRGATFRASVYGSEFRDALIKHITRPQYTVELINYLSRIINHDNLFEIYVNNMNVERYTLEELTFANSENDKQGRPALLDKTEYSEGLLDKDSKFILSNLMKTMNARFSYTFPSIEELDYVPICGYISMSGKLNGNWKAEPILHLAIIFNVLAHQDRFSGINNQEAIASFNSIMKAKRLNVAAQDLNEHEYKNEIKRLKLELKREQQRAKGLEIKNKTLEEKIEEMNSKLDAQTQALNEANIKLDASAQREQQLITQNEHTHQELEHANAQRDELQASLNQAHEERQQLINEQQEMKEAVITLSDNMNARLDALRDGFEATVTDSTLRVGIRNRVLCLYEVQPLTEKITHAEGELILDSFCGFASNERSSITRHAIPFVDERDECIFRVSCSDAIDIFDWMRTQVPNTIAVECSYRNERKIKVRAGRLEDFKQRLRRIASRAVHAREAYGRFIDDMKTDIRDDIQAIVHEEIAQVLEQEQAHHQEQMQAVANAEANINAHIDNAVNEIEEHIDEAIAPIIALFYQLHPNATQVYYNHAYRLLIIQNDKIYCHILKSSNQLHELTEEELHKLRFK